MARVMVMAGLCLVVGGMGDGWAAAPVPGVSTPAAIAVSNLDAQLEGYKAALAARPGEPSLTRKVVDLRLVRAQFLGRSSDFSAMLGEAAAAVSAHPESASARVLHARVLAALHRFDEADAELVKAEALGHPAADIARRRGLNALAAGDDADGAQTLERLQARAKARPGFSAHVDVANALKTLGRYEEADAAFVAAARAYRNVSPFARAWVDFQRGVMWAEAADQPEKALALYEAAVRRLPLYHVAAVHLAEMLVEAGDLERALAILRPVAASAEDPEATGFLGELLDGRGAATAREAARLIADAKGRYDRLLASHEAAYADHAAEFFSGPGADLPRALTLAKSNLAHRASPRAHDLAIRVAMAAGDRVYACAVARRAQTLTTRTPVLDATLATTAAQCSSPAP